MNERERKYNRKPKFKPVITRVKLNPEQAVLSCDCWNYGWIWNVGVNYAANSNATMCRYVFNTSKVNTLRSGGCTRTSGGFIARTARTAAVS